MTKIMLDKFLMQSIPRAILLYGESEFFVFYYSKLIVQKLATTPQTIYFDEYNHEEALSSLGINSLFADTNVLVLKLYKTLSKTQVKDLFFMLSHNPKSYLIVEFYKSPTITQADYAKRFKAMSMLFKPTSTLKDVLEVRFYQPQHDEMLKILEKKAQNLKINMDINHLKYLLSIQNYDLSIAYNELEKFVYYPEITYELIDSLSYSLGSMKIETLLNSLFEKKGHLIQIIQTLSEEGIDSMDLLRELCRYFYLLFKLYGHSKKYGTIDSQEALGYKAPPQILNTWSRRSLKITTQKYLTLFDIFNAWRVQQLQGKDVSLQYLVEIQRIL